MFRQYMFSTSNTDATTSENETTPVDHAQLSGMSLIMHIANIQDEDERYEVAILHENEDLSHLLAIVKLFNNEVKKFALITACGKKIPNNRLYFLLNLFTTEEERRKAAVYLGAMGRIDKNNLRDILQTFAKENRLDLVHRFKDKVDAKNILEVSNAFGDETNMTTFFVEFAEHLDLMSLTFLLSHRIKNEDNKLKIAIAFNKTLNRSDIKSLLKLFNENDRIKILVNYIHRNLIPGSSFEERFQIILDAQFTEDKHRLWLISNFILNLIKQQLDFPFDKIKGIACYFREEKNRLSFLEDYCRSDMDKLRLVLVAWDETGPLVKDPVAFAKNIKGDIKNIKDLTAVLNLLNDLKKSNGMVDLKDYLSIFSLDHFIALIRSQNDRNKQHEDYDSFSNLLHDLLTETSDFALINDRLMLGSADAFFAHLDFKVALDGLAEKIQTRGATDQPLSDQKLPELVPGLLRAVAIRRTNHINPKDADYKVYQACYIAYKSGKLNLKALHNLTQKINLVREVNSSSAAGLESLIKSLKTDPIETGQRRLDKIIVGALLIFVGAVFVAACIGLAVVSFGGSIPGFVFGYSLMHAGLAIAGSLVGAELTIAFGMFAYSGRKQGLAKVFDDFAEEQRAKVAP